MSYWLAYVVEGQEEPVDGDHVASGTGWDRWGDWVAGKADAYPEAAHLAEEGWSEPPEVLAELEHELERLPHEEGATPDLSAVTAHLLAALRQRPEDTVAVLVTDGEPGEEEATDPP